jgi:ribonuclease P protein subunit RPR2
MAKAKATKTKGITQKHLHSRISYLYQAATYLSTHEVSRAVTAGPTLEPSVDTESLPPAPAVAQDEIQAPSPSGMVNLPLARLYAAQLREVSLKSQIRLSSDLKRSLCKRCNTLQMPPLTATTRVENLSRGGKKAWADVLVVQCNACSTEKRFPIGSKRQTRRTDRTLACP